MTRPPIDREFEGKTAFVLGGSSGIGLASAELFAERGANVVVVGHAGDTYDVAGKIAGVGRKAIGLAGAFDRIFRETIPFFATGKGRVGNPRKETCCERNQD